MERGRSEREPVGERRRIDRDRAPAPFDRLVTALTLRNIGECSTGIHAVWIERVSSLRGHRRPAEIGLVVGDMRLTHELVLLPVHIKSSPAPAHRDEQNEPENKA